MGEVFAGRYELVDPIGRGGVGAVWRAWDHRRRRYVAAKVLQQSDAHSLLRFVREQALRIDHPNVLAPASWAADDDKVLFTMDLVAGGSLVHLVNDYGPLPPGFVCTLLDQLLSGLAAVHAEGVVHRDIKPANILLEATGTSRPRLRLSDFGIAMRFGEPRLTETNLVVGTPGYLAPEQMMGAEPDFPADLFAVGLVALYLLEGAKPDAKALLQYFAEHGTPGAPKGVPEPLWQVVATLVQPDPQARFRTATGARKALAAAAELLSEPGPDEEQIEIFDQLGFLPKGFGTHGPLRPAAGHGDAPPTPPTVPGAAGTDQYSSGTPSPSPWPGTSSRSTWPPAEFSESSEPTWPGSAAEPTWPGTGSVPSGQGTASVPSGWGAAVVPPTSDPRLGCPDSAQGEDAAPADPQQAPSTPSAAPRLGPDTPPAVPTPPQHSPGVMPAMPHQGPGAAPSVPRMSTGQASAAPGAQPSVTSRPAAPPATVAPGQAPTPAPVPSMSDTGSFHLPPPQIPQTPTPQPHHPGHHPVHHPTDHFTHHSTPSSSYEPTHTHVLPSRRQRVDASTTSYTAQDPQVPAPSQEILPRAARHGRRARRTAHATTRTGPITRTARRPGPPARVTVPLLLLALACYAVGFWALTRI